MNESTLWRRAKLFINLAITGLVFSYFVGVLILLLNPHISLGSGEFFLLYLDLLVYYGPLWAILTGVIFFVIQFFSEKKYAIGIFNPPTITYFLSFTMLIVSFILYFNYDYYYAFFAPSVKAKFIKVLLGHLVLLIIGIFFVFLKRIDKRWIQLVFLAVLAINIVNSFHTIRADERFWQHIEKRDHIPRKIPALAGEEGEENPAAENRQRKIRIVIMDGLSLNLLQRLSSEERLLNFRLLINNGVRGRISGFKPNPDLSLINSALTGLPPSHFAFHSDKRYKFTGLHHEFDTFPRYIFFRNSALLDLTTFYKKDDHLVDNIDEYYRFNNYKTRRVIHPSSTPRYAPKSLHKNNPFVLRFSEILKKDDEKYTILKKAFFLDDYIRSIIPNLQDSDNHYAIIRFPGLEIISKFFYQYHDPDQLFSSISETDIKKYGQVIEKYYDYYDAIVGNLMTTTGDDELLVILSFFEYEPLPVWRRVLVNLYGQKDIFVYKSLGSQGTILLYEKSALKKDYPLETIDILDIFPSLIYYAGFQLSRELQGEVLKEIFTSEFQLNNPIDIDTKYSKF